MKRLDLESMVFNPPPLCERLDCCDLSCVWVEIDAASELKVWEGDQA